MTERIAISLYRGRARPPAARYRLLLVTSTFPPDQEAGARRWEMLAKHLNDSDMALDVATMDPSHVVDPDWERVRDLPQNVRAFGIVIREPHPAWRLLRSIARRGERWLRSTEHNTGPRNSAESGPTRSPGELIRIPRSLEDLQRLYVIIWELITGRRWAADVARAVTPFVAENDYDVVISSGPSHWAHLAGEVLGRTAQVPWVMEFRDPWSLAPSIAPARANLLHYDIARYYERRLIRRAAMVLTVTDQMSRDLASAYPSLPSRIVTIRNGSDDDPGPPPLRSRFVVCYAGSIYLDRDPRPLFEASRLVVRRLELRPEDFELRFIGNVESYGDRATKEIARDEGVLDYVTFLPQMPRHELKDHLAEASVLVSLPQNHTHAIPAKIFDYVRQPSWLLAITDRESEVARILRNTSADVLDPNDTEEIALAIEAHYREFQSGVVPSPADVGMLLGRSAQADLLVEQLTQHIFEARPKRSPGVAHGS